MEIIEVVFYRQALQVEARGFGFVCCHLESRIKLREENLRRERAE
jgi:hypothetical protein